MYHCFMKILFVSDSHSNTEAVVELAKVHPDCDLYLHAGDSEDYEYSLFPFETVKGNCDHFDNLYSQRIYQTPIGKLLMKHYPELTQKYDDLKLFLHGHTHRMCALKREGIFEICPGSISHSRDAEGESYAIIIVDNSIVDVTFYSLFNKKVLKKVKLI